MYVKFRNILSIIIGILPINIAMIWYRLNQSEDFTTYDMILYPLLIGSGFIFLIILLNKFLLRASFQETFNSGKGYFVWDVYIGLGLTIIYFIEFFLTKVTLYQWFPVNNSNNSEIINAIIDLSNNPILLIIWFIPVLWIGIALFEEIMRIFMLKCLINISEKQHWHYISILITSILIGFTHIYQGYAGVISIFLKSIIMCYFYYRYQRIIPLIISHGLYDGVQFLYLLILITK